MNPEITIVMDPETNAQSVMVGNVEYMKVYEDGAIDGYRGVYGSPELSEIVALRTKAYLEWITAKAAETHDLPSSLLA